MNIDWQGRRVAVVGLGVSNLALIRYLNKRGAQITGCDRLTSARMPPDRLRELQSLGVELRLGTDYLDRLIGYDAIFLTPGMVKDQPNILRAKQQGTMISSEIGLLLSICRARVVGITGSSGKSTTTALTGRMLTTAGITTHVGGNIGRPLIETVEDMGPDDVVVLELSSFQLELVDRSPGLAAVLNIAPNHLDVHDSMVSYIQAKANIVRYQTADDWAVLNAGDDRVRRFDNLTPGRIAWVGAGGETGARLEDGVILVRSNGREQVLCDRSDIPLIGDHNVDNVMTAALLALLSGAPQESVVRAIGEFRSLEHRLEPVASIGGVSYVNDSIATAPDRTIAALSAVSGPVVLIAGGYDKRLPLDELGRAIGRRVKALVLIGVTADRIAREASEENPDLPIVHSRTLADAVQAASTLAAAGDTVLLSPACASYDMFSSFEERGRAFREAVADLEPRQ